MKNFFYEGKVVGQIHDGVFTKVVDKSKHFMRNLNSWGIDKEVLNQLPDDMSIVYFDPKLDTQWQISAIEWREKGYEQDWGHGVQSFLNEKFFTKKDPKQPQLF